MRHVAVIGSGPAGLAAAEAALRRGAEVTVIDTAEQPGGQFNRMLPIAYAPTDPESIQHGWAEFDRRRTVLGHRRCHWLPETAVWAVEQLDDAPPRLHLLRGQPDGGARSRTTLDADAVVLATGAHDRVLPFPGWELPGVYTAGAAQALAKGERLIVGERVLVAGSGPFLLPVAESLLSSGTRVLGVLEANPLRTLARGWGRRPWQLAWQLGKLGELGGYAKCLLHNRTPYLTGRAVVEARGAGKLEEVVTARLRPDWSPIPGTRRIQRVDALCVSHAFTPQLELANAAGCAIRDGFIAVERFQRTSVNGVFAAGEITGIAGAPSAAAEGAIAGAVAAGVEPTRAALRARDRGRRFGERLGVAHPVGAGWPDWLSADTTICRCEGTDLKTLRGQDQTGSARAQKLGSRAGLGPCQGRICGQTVRELCSRMSTVDTPDIHRRPIAQPIRLGEMAAEPQRKERL